MFLSVSSFYKDNLILYFLVFCITLSYIASAHHDVVYVHL
jgi:hypothetical protein